MNRPRCSWCLLDAAHQLHLTLAFPGTDAVLPARYGLFACPDHATNDMAERVTACTVGRTRFDHVYKGFNSTPDWNRSHAQWGPVDAPHAYPGPALPL